MHGEGHRGAAHRPRDRAAVDRSARDAARRAARARAQRRRPSRRCSRSRELLVEALDGEAAARMLQEVLVARARERRARRKMLRELGYELVEEPDDGGASSRDSQRRRGRHDHRAVELRPRGAAAVVRPRGDRPRRRGAALVLGAEHPHRGGRARRDAGVGARARRHRRSVRRARCRASRSTPPPRARRRSTCVGAAAPTPDSDERRARRRRPSMPSGPPELESALEEAEFFASRGLFDDARTILTSSSRGSRTTRSCVERLAELDAQEHGMQGGSGTRPSPAAAASAVEDRSFDIAESLGALDGGDRASGIGPGGAARRPTRSTSKRSSRSSRRASPSRSTSTTRRATTISAWPTRRWASSTTPSASSRSPRATRARRASASR